MGSSPIQVAKQNSPSRKGRAVLFGGLEGNQNHDFRDCTPCHDGGRGWSTPRVEDMPFGECPATAASRPSASRSWVQAPSRSPFPTPPLPMSQSFIGSGLHLPDRRQRFRLPTPSNDRGPKCPHQRTDSIDPGMGETRACGQPVYQLGLSQRHNLDRDPARDHLHGLGGKGRPRSHQSCGRHAVHRDLQQRDGGQRSARCKLRDLNPVLESSDTCQIEERWEFPQKAPTKYRRNHHETRIRPFEIPRTRLRGLASATIARR